MTARNAAAAERCEQILVQSGARMVCQYQANPFGSLLPRQVEDPPLVEDCRLDHANQYYMAFAGRLAETPEEERLGVEARPTSSLDSTAAVKA